MHSDAASDCTVEEEVIGRKRQIVGILVRHPNAYFDNVPNSYFLTGPATRHHAPFARHRVHACARFGRRL